MTYPDISFVPVNYCVCVNLFLFFFVSMCGMSLSQGCSVKDNILITMILENVNHDTRHITVSRGLCSRTAPPLFASSSFLPQPFPPSEQSHIGNCFSVCKTKKRWKGTNGARTNVQRLGLPKVHRLPTERYFLSQQQSRSVPPPPRPC